MKKIVLATSNPHKLDEINAINNNCEIVFDVINGNFDPEENGKNFVENATIKAVCGSKVSNSYCLADDSGLCVDALDGRPGIFSARYADSQQEKIEKLLAELKDIPKEKRTAHFTCAMVLTSPNGEVLHIEEGRVDGYIDFERKGENGFGYDPIFFVPKYNKTMAELPEEVKNSISHRANALMPMLKWINENL